MRPESLKSFFHLRYGGCEGISYYLASDAYIALFSRVLACGTYEAHAILDLRADSRSLLQATMTHSDTHGQSAAIFGLARPLGIELLPRIRGWQDLHLFRPGAAVRCGHIDDLFTAAADWHVIEAHLPDMLRAALSIRTGTLLPSASCADSPPATARAGSTSLSASSAAPFASISCSAGCRPSTCAG